MLVGSASMAKGKADQAEFEILNDECKAPVVNDTAFLEPEAGVGCQPEQALTNLRLGHPAAVVPFFTAQIIASIENLPERHVPELCHCHESRRLHLNGQATLGAAQGNFCSRFPIWRIGRPRLAG